MNHKIRYINDTKNENIGFSNTEIEKLQKLVEFKFPTYYIDFLKTAGKKSNVLNSEFNCIQDLIDLQEAFKLKINKSDITDFTNTAWCFTYSENNYFYFELNNGKNPMVFLFSNTYYPADNGWNNKLGLTSKKNKFIEFINSKTNEKYSFTAFEKIKSYITLIIFSPFLLILYLFLELGKRLK